MDDNRHSPPGPVGQDTPEPEADGGGHGAGAGVGPGVREGIRWRGHVKITANFRDGRPPEVQEFDNLIVDDGLDLAAAALAGGDFEINYCAVGDDNASPAAGDSALGNEEFRKVITKQEAGATGIMVTTCYIAPYEAVDQIEEIGWFVGGTATPDSGTLLARVLYSRNKTNLESLQIERTDTFS